MNPLLQKFTRNAQATFYGPDNVPGSQTQVSAGDRGFGKIMRDAVAAGIGVSVMASVAISASSVGPVQARINQMSSDAMKKDVAIIEAASAKRTLVYFVEDDSITGDPDHPGVTHAAFVQEWSQAEFVQAQKLTAERRHSRLESDARNGVIESCEALQAAFPEIVVMSRADALRHAQEINAGIVAEADAAPTAPGGRF